MKRLLAILLSLSLLCLVVLAAACGDNPGDETTSGTTPSEQTSGTTGSDSPDETTGSGEETSGTDETTGSTGPTELDWDTMDPYAKPAGFEDVDFGGRTFVIAAYIGADGWESNKEIYSDETDSISVAVRQRNQVMEELYNCTIQLNESEAPGALVTADISSGAHTIDMYCQKYNLGSLASSGSNYDLYTLGIDLTNPWYDQTYVNTYSLRDQTGNIEIYSVIGDWAISCFEAVHCLVYNKTVYENAGITDNIYELVRNKEWTMDKFMEMVKLAVYDADGNSEYHYTEGDILGWVRTAHATHGLHVASNLPIIQTVDGVMSFAITDRVQEWNDVIDTAITVWAMPEGETLGYSSIPDCVASGHTLFASEVIALLETMRDMEVSVGLVPYPLYSESQDNYAHYTDNHLMPYAVPISVPDPLVMGEFIEVFGFHSRYIVRSAWVEAYAYEYCSDVDSAEMLEIILDTRTYDPGYLLFTNEGDISLMIDTARNDISRYPDRYAARAATSIATLIEQITNNNA